MRKRGREIMSGGSYDYMYCRIEDYYVGHMKDIELNDLMKDIVELVHDLEWADSSDISDEDYFETFINAAASGAGIQFGGIYAD